MKRKGIRQLIAILICVGITLGLLDEIPMVNEYLGTVKAAEAADYSEDGCVRLVKARAAQIGITLPATGTNSYGLYGASAYWTNLPASYARGNEPAANALAVWEFSSNAASKYYGHVAFVESVNGDSVTLTEGGLPANYTYAGNTGVRSITTSKGQIGTLGGCSGFLGYIYLKGTPQPSGNNPEGCIDYVEGKEGSIWVHGWAFDRDNVGTSIDIHVYIGGAAGSGGEGHIIKADKERADVNDVYKVGNYHGFDDIITTTLTGVQDVYIYVITIGGGGNVYLGHRTVEIKPAPTPSATPMPSATQKPIATAQPTPKPSATVKPSATQKPTTSAKPSATTKPVNTAKPSATADPNTNVVTTPKPNRTGDSTTDDNHSSINIAKASGIRLKKQKSGKLNVTWNAVKNADGYQVQIAANSSFTKNKSTKLCIGRNYTKSGMKKEEKVFRPGAGIFLSKWLEKIW